MSKMPDEIFIYDEDGGKSWLERTPLIGSVDDNLYYHSRILADLRAKVEAERDALLRLAFGGEDVTEESKAALPYLIYLEEGDADLILSLLEQQEEEA